MTRIQANLILLLAGAIWGAGFVAQSTAMETIGPLWFTCLRFTIAALVLAPFAVRERQKAPVPLAARDLRGFVAIGLSLCLAVLAQQIGIMTTTVANSGFLTGLYVVLVPILTVLFLRRRPHWIIWPAAGLSFLGIFLLSGGALSQLTRGDLLTLLAALFCAVQVILITVFAHSSGRPFALSLVQFATCAVLAGGLALVLEPLSFDAIKATIPELLYSGIFSSGVAFTLQVVGQRYTTAPQAAIFLSSEALFAAFFGVLLLGETIAPIGYLGGLIIFAAMLMVEIVPELGRKRAERTLSHQ
ncbi:MFS transporter [Rhizobium sp. Leaf384]|uniref:DMT family transporter n=1 Tax=unclassified Rhizobium TaxID=2613769 RepID=UPI00071353D2|nr:MULTISPECIES: DMT family transporter [unclassified Rhizobium]KQS77189.1 MFS transporter [Rhizobium sp. Leaf384]KQS78569.1 MFS transporter [Rhizobium sp. Leaf383]